MIPLQARQISELKVATRDKSPDLCRSALSLGHSTDTQCATVMSEMDTMFSSPAMNVILLLEL